MDRTEATSREPAAWARFLDDSRGQVTVEYGLLLAAFGVPMILMLGWLMSALSGYFHMVVYLETLPLP